MFARHCISLLSVALIAAPAFSSAQQTVYRWVDKDGKVSFSDTPPPKEITNATQKQVGGGFAPTSNLPFATQVAMKNNPVTLYTTADCGRLCEQGRSLLASRGIPYTERDTSIDKAAYEEVMKLLGQVLLPLLTVGQNKVRGFDEPSWQAALDTGGYLRTALPGYVPPVPVKPEPPKAVEAAPAAPAAPATPAQ